MNRRGSHAILIILSLLILSLGCLSRLLLSGSLVLWSQPLSDQAFVSSQPEEEVTFEQIQNWVKVEKFDLAPCRGLDGNPNNAYWAVLKVSNSRPDLWMNDASGSLEFFSNNQSMGGFTFSDFAIGPQAVRWFVDPNLLGHQKTFPLKTPSIDSARIRFNVGDLYRPNKELSGVKLNAELISFDTTTAEFPRHSLKIRVSNPGTEAIYHTKVFAAVFNTAGNLVDIAWSEKPAQWPVGKKLAPNESATFTLDSLARTGACLGAADPNGYQVEYWVDGLTYSGMPVFSSYPVQSVKPSW